jgi:LmbE family N-acetylglucosaminyl deacetylase
MARAAVDERAGPAPVDRVVEAEWARFELSARATDLEVFYGPRAPVDRAPRVLGLFAHPDDEVFCFGGTIARCAEAGAVTAVASLTHGEAGQIRDAATATRRSLAAVRRRELENAAAALGVGHVTCLDYADGRLPSVPLPELAEVAGSLIDQFAPDVVVTFGPDGGFGHPDHTVSCLATMEAVRAMAAPPRLLHAKFPVRGQLMLDMLVDWLLTNPRLPSNTEAFCNALKLFAVGTSMLGVTADTVNVEWYPPGSYIVEQGEAANELYCVLSGEVDVIVERADGALEHRRRLGVGEFFGEVGLATGHARNANVVASGAVTCLVLARDEPSLARGRGAGADPSPDRQDVVDAVNSILEDCVMVNVRSTLERKVHALSAHRSQYALEPGLLPTSMLERLLGTERFVVTDASR